MNECIDDNAKLNELVKVYEKLEVYNMVDFDALSLGKSQFQSDVEKVKIVDYHSYTGDQSADSEGVDLLNRKGRKWLIDLVDQKLEDVLLSESSNNKKQ